MPLSHYALDTYVSQHLSKLDACTIVSVEAEFPDRAEWFAGYTLRRIFHAHVPDDKAALAFVLLRRADAAFGEWESACQTLAQVSVKKTVAGYFEALRHLEACVAALEQWYAFARNAMNLQSFTKADGSIQERLNFVYNVSRHFDPSALQPGDLHRIWITNDGLHVQEKALLFSELAEMLRQVGKSAVALGGAANAATS